MFPIPCLGCERELGMCLLSSMGICAQQDAAVGMSQYRCAFMKQALWMSRQWGWVDLSTIKVIPWATSGQQLIPRSALSQELSVEFIMEMLGHKDAENLSTQQRKAPASIPRTPHSRHNDNSSELKKLCSNPGGHSLQWDEFKRLRFPGLSKSNQLGHGGWEFGEGFLSWLLQVPSPYK